MQEDRSANQALSLARRHGWAGALPLWRASGGSAEAVDQLLSGWAEAGRGAFPEAAAHLDHAARQAALAPWARLGRAVIAARRRDFAAAHALLDQVRPPAANGHLAHPDADGFLTASALFHRGVTFYGQGQLDAALPALEEALDRFDPADFAFGHVLDTLGSVHAARHRFYLARQFYEAALDHKQRAGDEAGLALTHGSFGRLFLDWGDPARAEPHFRTDLDLCRRDGHAYGVAQMCNFLGQAELAMGHVAEAAEWQERCLDAARERWPALEGFAAKDRARAHLAAGELEAADQMLQRAAELLTDAGGRAHVDRELGVLRRAAARYADSGAALGRAIEFFDGHDLPAEAARSMLEMARTRRAAGAADGPEWLARGLACAERARRAHLVREIEAELGAADEVALCRHLYHRVRGRNVAGDAVSLLSGTRETVSVMFVDVQGSTEFVRTTEPDVVMMTLNEIFADLEALLEQSGAAVNQYLGDGFLALFRGADPAGRAVAAGVEVGRAVERINRPRAKLGLRRLDLRVGIATGEAFLGNIGTYRKMDFTAVGVTTHRAARLQSDADPGLPCVCAATYERVKERFAARDGSPRTAVLKGLGAERVWDIVGERADAPAA